MSSMCMCVRSFYEGRYLADGTYTKAGEYWTPKTRNGFSRCRPTMNRKNNNSKGKRK